MLLFTVVGFLIVTELYGAPGTASIAQPKIVGGRNVKTGEFPFMLSVQQNGKHICGATVWSVYNAVTAAHCVYGIDFRQLTVVAGTVQLSMGGQQRSVTGYVIHEEYDPETRQNDIAYIKLNTSWKLSDLVDYAPLPGTYFQPTPSGVIATAIGWGLLEPSGTYPDRLQAVDIIVFEDDTCRTMFGINFNESVICAGFGGVGICDGDDGGPLMVDGKQVGIASWYSNPCTVDTWGAVYSESAYFIVWFKSHTCSQMGCP